MSRHASKNSYLTDVADSGDTMLDRFSKHPVLGRVSTSAPFCQQPLIAEEDLDISKEFGDDGTIADDFDDNLFRVFFQNICGLKMQTNVQNLIDIVISICYISYLT